MKPVLAGDGREKDSLTPPYQRNNRSFLPRKGRNPSQDGFTIWLFLIRIFPLSWPIGAEGFSFTNCMPEVAKAFVNVYYDTAASPYPLFPKDLSPGMRGCGSRKDPLRIRFPIDFTQEIFSGDGGIGPEKGRSGKDPRASIFLRLLGWDRKGASCGMNS